MEDSLSIPPLIVYPYPPGVPFLFLEASDGDAPGTTNSDLRFHILSQSPVQPLPDMFQLDPQLGALALSPDGKHELSLLEGGRECWRRGL